MKLTVNEIDYDVVGFDDYMEAYKKASRPEYQNDGEQELINELECDDVVRDCYVVVSLPGEKSVDGEMHTFHFKMLFEDDVRILYYYSNYS